MADVQVNTPQPVQSTGGGSSAVWAILVIVLLAIIAWFVFGRGMMGGSKDTNIKADVKVSTPAAPAPTKTP